MGFGPGRSHGGVRLFLIASKIIYFELIYHLQLICNQNSRVKARDHGTGTAPHPVMATRTHTRRVRVRYPAKPAVPLVFSIYTPDYLDSLIYFALMANALQ